MQSQKIKIVLIIISIIALLLLLISGGIEYYIVKLSKEVRQKQQYQQPNTTSGDDIQKEMLYTTQDETTNWQVYIDQDNQWRIKLPKNYIESKDNNATIFTSKVLSNNFNVGNLGYDITVFVAFYITKGALPMNISLNDYVDALTKPKYNEGLGAMFAELYNIQTVNVGNNYFIKAQVGGDGCPTDSYFIAKNQREYMRIDVARCFDFRDAVKDGGMRMQLLREINLILSTFKFTKSDI